MKILVIHQYYLLDGFPGGSRFNEFSRLWSEAGHEVTVVAGNLDYTTGVSPEKYRGRWLVEEQDGPVRVIRCHVPRTYSKSNAGRMWAFFGFTLSSMTAVLKATRPDVIIATSPPLLTCIPGWIAARLRFRRTPMVFEVRDLWPETAVTAGVLSANSALTRFLYLMEAWAYRSADRVNVLTPAFREDIANRGLLPREGIDFVPNGADVQAFAPGSREGEVRQRFGFGEKFVAMYTGAHGRANAIHQLVDAADSLRDRPDVLIVTVGDGPERPRCEALAKQRGLTNIRFLGPQPKSEMPAFVNACDAGLAVLQNNPTFRTVYPNKVFDYMACERPTVLAIDGVARSLVCDDAQAGVFAEPENGPAIAAAIVGLADDRAAGERMGKSGRAWVLKNATRESLAQQYLEVMERLVRK